MIILQENKYKNIEVSRLQLCYIDAINIDKTIIFVTDDIDLKINRQHNTNYNLENVYNIEYSMPYYAPKLSYSSNLLPSDYKMIMILIEKEAKKTIEFISEIKWNNEEIVVSDIPKVNVDHTNGNTIHTIRITHHVCILSNSDRDKLNIVIPKLREKEVRTIISSVNNKEVKDDKLINEMLVLEQAFKSWDNNSNEGKGKL